MAWRTREKKEKEEKKWSLERESLERRHKKLKWECEVILVREIFEGRKERIERREEGGVEKLHGYGGVTHECMKIKRSEAPFVIEVKLHWWLRRWIFQAPIWCCMCWSLRYYCCIPRHHLNIKVAENWLHNWWIWTYLGMQK